MSISVNVPLYDGIEEVLEDWVIKSQKDALYRARERIFDECRELIPLGRSGRLRASFDVDVSSKGLRLVLTEPYAKIVEEGAHPHRIWTKKARILRFWIGGKPVFSTFTDHPGYPGRGYVAKLRQRAYEILIEELRLALERNRRMVER